MIPRIDTSKQRKPKPTHPWAQYAPGWLRTHACESFESGSGRRGCSLGLCGQSLIG
jgi:hypothetical protein